MTHAFVADRALKIQLSVEDLAMLTVLAETDGIGLDEEIRSLIRSRYAERFDRNREDAK